MRKILPLLVLLFITACGPVDHVARIEKHLVAPSFAAPVPADHASLAERMAYYHVPGVSIAVIHDGHVAWAKGYGTADLSTHQPVDEHTLFHGASLSKTVNAITVMKFVQDGKLKLDEDVNKQLTAWKLPDSPLTNGKTITLRRLLSHTAGMGVRFLGVGYPEDGPMPSLVDFLNGKPPATQPVKVVEEPGKRFYYSGGAIAISQLMIEEAAHQPYPQIAKRTVFDPLGMSESTFELKLRPEWRQRAAPGYKDGKRVNGPDRVYPAMSAAGLWTTPRDFAQVVIEIHTAAHNPSGKILTFESALEMVAPYVENAKSPNPRGSKVGLGLFMAGKGEAANFFHAGSHAGYSCYAVGLLNKNDGVVVMTNGDNAFDLISEIVQTVAKEYGWHGYEVVPPPKPTPTTAPSAR
jgi:CubicO group peptidase (beta-lactamase class C family)